MVNHEHSLEHSTEFSRCSPSADCALDCSITSPRAPNLHSLRVKENGAYKSSLSFIFAPVEQSLHSDLLGTEHPLIQPCTDAWVDVIHLVPGSFRVM